MVTMDHYCCCCYYYYYYYCDNDNDNNYRVVQKKTAQNLMHCNFSTAGHRVTRFPSKCSETNW